MNSFFAYPAKPNFVGQTIEEAVSILNADIKVTTWKALDVVGSFIADKVIEKIDGSDLVIADISQLNFNVTYEIGYAIGKERPVALVRNTAVRDTGVSLRDVGIFDTLGYFEYVNSSDLEDFLQKLTPVAPLNTRSEPNLRAPVYLLNTRHKTDWILRIVSRIKKAGYTYREFDPAESPRLSAYEAITHVSQSYGVVVPLLDGGLADAESHNICAAFLAGLAMGLGKPLCLLQFGAGPTPVDYRDFVVVNRALKDVNPCIADFAAKVAESIQASPDHRVETPKSFLQKLDLGSSSAENEMRTLTSYYLKTDAFNKTERGEAHIVVGRKGSGKSAVFFQVRDREKKKKGNLVLDLKPEGYKLIKFKELVLKFLKEGTYQHTITTFWEYLIYLEICYKILEADKEMHMRDIRLYEPYRALSTITNNDRYLADGDFSERTSILISKIGKEYAAKYGVQREVSLSDPEITQLLHCQDVREIRDILVSYLKHKEIIWILFDNIDKGWPTTGLEREDLLIIRTLIDAARKIERDFGKHDIEVRPVVFLRNDVYDLLVRETSDRGKEGNVLLDWNDADTLREFLRLRFSASGLTGDLFQALWTRVCVSHIEGEESSQYVIDRSLMRPRFLLNLVNQCKSIAINLSHEIIEENDVKKGLSAYSTDLITDIGYEIRDIIPSAEQVLYAFIGCDKSISRAQITQLLLDGGIPDADCDRVFDLLLWHGFFGVIRSGREPMYIFDCNYNMSLLQGVARNLKPPYYSINPAFWSGLLIGES